MMKPGTKKWGTLATWANAEIYIYFRTVMAQDHLRAVESVREVRMKFAANGEKYSTPVSLPFNFWSPSQAEVMAADLAVAQRAAEPEITIGGVPYTAEPEASEPEIEISGGDSLAKTLARALAPAFMREVEKRIAAAVAKLAPEIKTQLLVLNGKTETVIEGSFHELAPKVIGLVNAGCNVMLVGPAGCGKTRLATTVSQALGLGDDPTVVSCSAGMSEAQLLGRLLPLGERGAFRYVESPFMRVYANGGVVLLDEMDGIDANTLLVLNAALAKNGSITVEARAANGLPTMVKRHPKCVILAAANTWGNGADTNYIARGALDKSSTDRFYRVPMDYDTKLEALCGTERTVKWVHEIRAKARAAKLQQIVSVRMIENIDAAVASGISFEEACADQLAPWSADERRKVA